MGGMSQSGVNVRMVSQKWSEHEKKRKESVNCNTLEILFFVYSSVNLEWRAI